MSREVRRVPPTWQHPKNVFNNYVPLYADSISEAIEKWDSALQTWMDNPEVRDLCRRCGLCSFEDFNEPPQPNEYMPDWPSEDRTHYQLYENVWGTPLSPAFETVEELAKWLADTGAKAFADKVSTFEQWLALCTETVLPIKNK